MMQHVTFKSIHLFIFTLIILSIYSSSLAQGKQCSTKPDITGDVLHTKKRVLPNWQNADDDESSEDDTDYEDDSDEYDSSSEYDSDSDELQFALDDDFKGFEDKSDLNAWERQRLFRRLIKSIEELKIQLAQEQLDLLSASDAVATAATKAINERTEGLEKNIAAMQNQLASIAETLQTLCISVEQLHAE